jgi:hypothetical protein
MLRRFQPQAELWWKIMDILGAVDVCFNHYWRLLFDMGDLDID